MEGWRAGITGFVVGVCGWLLVGALHLENLAVWIAVLTLGVAVGVVAPRRPAVVGLLLGLLVSYPIALFLGTIAFLGENWATYVVMFGAVAVIGYAVGRVVAPAIGRQVGSMRSLPQR